MKCFFCGKNVNPEVAYYCADCGKIYCPECSKGKNLCDCYGELQRFN